MTKEDVAVMGSANGAGDPRTNWTIMVYLAGDNNVADECVYTLTEKLVVHPQPNVQHGEERFGQAVGLEEFGQSRRQLLRQPRDEREAGPGRRRRVTFRRAYSAAASKARYRSMRAAGAGLGAKALTLVLRPKVA